MGTQLITLMGKQRGKKVWCSMNTILRYLDILENAFIIDSVNGWMGKNLIANFDMGVRARIHELSVANTANAFGEYLLMSLDAMQASTPTRALLVEEHNKHKAIQKRKSEDENASASKRARDSSDWGTWPKASFKAPPKGLDSDKKNGSPVRVPIIRVNTSRGPETIT